MTGHNRVQNSTNKTRPQPVQSHQQYPWKTFSYPLPIKIPIFKLLLQVFWLKCSLHFLYSPHVVSPTLSSLFDQYSVTVINYQVLQSCISLHHSATSYLVDQILLKHSFPKHNLVFLACLTLEDDGTTNFSNNGNHSSNNKLSHPIRLGSSHLSPYCERQKYHTHTKQWVKGGKWSPLTGLLWPKGFQEV